MLKELHFSYVEYLVLISTSFASKAVFMPTIGAAVSRAGASRLLFVGGVGIVPLAGLWAVSDSFGWLLGVQILSGAIWAIYELCTFLLLFEHIPVHERTSVLTGFNLAHAIATVTGALIGGALLHAIGPSPVAYITLFLVSTGMRAVSIVFLARLREATFTPAPISIRTLAVRPNAGSIDAPIVSSIVEEEEE